MGTPKKGIPNFGKPSFTSEIRVSDSWTFFRAAHVTCQRARVSKGVPRREGYPKKGTPNPGNCGSLSTSSALHNPLFGTTYRQDAQLHGVLSKKFCTGWQEQPGILGFFLNLGGYFCLTRDQRAVNSLPKLPWGRNCKRNSKS